MKKFTKRLTMIVAILLSLVLLTSSIVSTTLAKYVVAKSAEVTARLDKFGVTVNFNSDALKNGTTNPTIDQKGDSISYTYSEILLHPGDAARTVTASVHGKPTVDANIVVDVKVEFTSGNFSIGEGNFTDLNDNATYFPIEFKVGGTTCSEAYTTDDAAAISSKIKSAIVNALVEKDKIVDEGDNLKWTAGKEIDQASPKNVSLSFSWPKDSGTTGKMHDEIGTFISKNQPTFKITYRISVEQA
jgi:hypothetical protein